MKIKCPYCRTLCFAPRPTQTAFPEHTVIQCSNSDDVVGCGKEFAVTSYFEQHASVRALGEYIEYHRSHPRGL